MHTVNFILAAIQRSLLPLIQRSILASILATFLAAVTVISCSKSTTPHDQRGLLTWKPWKLQRQDSLALDSNNQVRSVTTRIFEDCKTQYTRIFSTTGYITGYTGCIRPLNVPDKTGESWYLGDDNIMSLITSGPPRSGPELQVTDSVITLTADSLVTINRSSSGDYPFPNFWYSQHYLKRSYFTH